MIIQGAILKLKNIINLQINPKCSGFSKIISNIYSMVDFSDLRIKTYHLDKFLIITRNYCN